MTKSIPIFAPTISFVVNTVFVVRALILGVELGSASQPPFHND